MPPEIFIVEHDLILDGVRVVASNEEEDVEDDGQDEDDEEDGDFDGKFCFSYLHEANYYSN